MMAKKEKPAYATEADLCRAFMEECAAREKDWTAYPESGGFDILLVRKKDGCQVGVEAKLKLNPEVVSQALPRWSYDFGCNGPDYRAVLVPEYAVTAYLGTICQHIGITIIRQSPARGYIQRTFSPRLPTSWDEDGRIRDWHPWCPDTRLRVPDYVPDVVAGSPSPIKLTGWKVRAIRLAILLEERPVTRSDFKALGLDPKRWTDKVGGWLTPTPNGYVAGPHMPDFKSEHPRNWDEIKADRAVWGKDLGGLL